ncbi:unnamed protein product, partial [Rotaria magnacalcarata]
GDKAVAYLKRSTVLRRESIGIHVFSRQQALVMNSGKPVYLQFMLIENGKLFYNLYIVGENYVSPNEITDQCLLTDIKRLIVDPTDDNNNSLYRKEGITKNELNAFVRPIGKQMHKLH